MLTLKPNFTPGARVVQDRTDAWHMEIPAGSKGHYQLAQLDDYTGLSREAFLWRPGLKFSLNARASNQDIAGTWGFCLWNDPFSLSLGLGGGTRRWPALPNAAWFFFASEPNYLSLRDDLPAVGATAATFRAPHWPTMLLALIAPALPLLLWPPGARLLRRIGRRFVEQDSVAMDINPVEWHCYSIEWQADSVLFQVDGNSLLESQISPLGPMGVVIWVDNQYAALPPSGRFSYGTLAVSEPAWVEVAEACLTITPGAVKMNGTYNEKPTVSRDSSVGRARD
jgi:hypothetical protein